FYGQHEHRKLMLASAQLDVLDGYCGGEQLELRARVAQEFARFRALERRVEELRAAAGARDRELDLVRFELEEIESAAPSADEQHELLAERERLRNFEALQSAAVTALRALAPDQDGGAVELLAGAAKALESVVALDKPLAELSARLDELRYEADELSREVRSQVVEMEFDPGRLEE